MTSPLSALVQRLTELDAKASDAPWKCWNGWGPHTDGLMRCERIGPGHGGGIMPSDPGHCPDMCAATADFELVAELRNSLPVLLAALGESRAEGLEEAAALCRKRAVYLQQWLDAGNGTPEQRTWHAGKLVEVEALEQEIRALSSKPSALGAETERTRAYCLQAVEAAHMVRNDLQRDYAALVAERDALKAALTEIFDAIEQWPERECGRSIIREVQFGRKVLQRWRAALSGGTQTKEEANG